MAMTRDAGDAGDAAARDDGGESQVVLVDDLAAADDYWLTITDAARVTRRQEITIRRWIAAGVLPVRRQRMGLNKRTRHVRASDLARLTPIIDPMATITGAPANADLLSIPLQHAQLLTAQQALTARLTQYEQTLADLSAQRDADHLMLDQQEAQLHAANEATALVRQDLQAEIRDLREATQAEIEELRQATTALASLVQQVEAAIHDVADQLTRARADHERGHAELRAGQTSQAAAMHQLEEVTQHVHAQQAQAEQEQRAWQDRLAGVMAQLLDQQTMTTTLSDQVTTLQQEQQDWQRQLATLQDDAATLHTHLQAERRRRRVLEQQVQVRALRAFRRRHLRRLDELPHADDATDSH